ncbi:MAG: hypothetical protein QOE27_1567, partial [Solirubrobacteraceae bacterium]|nr:hypothetical protein [Solirubrobacteraceae bacterium]
MIRILRRAASDGNNAPAASEAPGPGGRRSQRFEAAISGYVGRIAGADRADRLTRTVLAEVGDAEAAAAVTRAARTAALGELERDARRPRARAERLADLHWRCAATPGLLRERLESEISKAGLDALYLHLDHCEHCAGIAARCDLAEWHLEAELAGPGPAAANGAGGYRPIRPGLPGAIGSPSPRPVGTPAGGGALAHWGRVEAPGAGPAGSGHGPRSGRGLGRRLAGAPRGRLAAAAILAVIILVAAVALLGGGGGHVARTRTGLGAAGTGAAATPPVAVSPGAGPTPVSPAAAPPGTSSGVAPAASPATSATAAVHGLRNPFVVGQARYAVF